jgi:hypothetical protein
MPVRWALAAGVDDQGRPIGASYTRWMSNGDGVYQTGSSVMMILQGGPLDGEAQLVEMVPTDPGSKMFFSVPGFQFFDANGNYLYSGLEATYELVGPGPDPDPDAGEYWDAAWIFTFEGGNYQPPYPPGAMYPDLDFVDPGEGPVGQSTEVRAVGSGFLVVMALYMPVSPGGANTDNVVPSFQVVDDNTLTFNTIASSESGSYDLVMDYTDQIGNSAFVRWTGVFQFQ